MSILTADEVGVTDGVMSILTVDEVGVTGGVNTYCRRGRCHRVCHTHRCGTDWHSFPLVLLVFSPALRDKTQFSELTPALRGKTQTQHTDLWTHPGTKRQYTFKTQTQYTVLCLRHKHSTKFSELIPVLRSNTQTQHTVLRTHPGTKRQDENTVHNSVNSPKQIKWTDTSRGQDCIKSPRHDKLLDTNTAGHDWRNSHKQFKQPDTTAGQDCRKSLRQNKWLDTNTGQHWLNSNRANS